VARANSYPKVEGKPVVICAHGTVALQHAAMSVYDAFSDHSPVYMILGNTQDATRRGSEVIWVHCAQDPAAIVPVPNGTTSLCPFRTSPNRPCGPTKS
jgi:hypothetical protein